MPLFKLQPPAFVRCLPFAVFIAALAVRGALDGHVDTRWLYAVQAGAAAFALMALWRHYGELHANRKVVLLSFEGLLSVVVGLVVFALWIGLDEPWMQLGESATGFVPVLPDGGLRWGQIALRASGAVLVVPVMEELFWRSFLMRWIDRRDFLAWAPEHTSTYAWVASSAVFALAHTQWLAGLIAGLVFGALYRRTGQIWHAIVAHGVANLALAAWVVHQRAWGYW